MNRVFINSFTIFLDEFWLLIKSFSDFSGIEFYIGRMILIFIDCATGSTNLKFLTICAVNSTNLTSVNGLRNE